MKRCPAVQAVDITYSIYFGPCIYLSKQTCRNEKKSTMDMDKEDEKKKQISIFLILFF